jgi:cell division septation protein DedD
MAQERRHFQRIALDSPVRVLLDESENGFLLDVCEGGLAVCELGPRAPGNVVPFVFDLPEGIGRIQGRAEIIWKSASGHRTGLHFVEMDDPCRERLVHWISSQAWTMKLDGVDREQREPARATPAAEPRVTPPIASPTDEGDHTWMLASATNATSADSEPRNAGIAPAGPLWSQYANEAKLVGPLGVAGAALVLLLTLGFLLYRSHGTPASAEARNSTSTAQLPPSAPEVSAAAPTAPSTPTAPVPQPASSISAGSMDNGGVILQVGAMTHEAYANALAKDLKQKGLPAFVFRREGDNFYRVAVGPFSGSQSALAAKDTLEKQGLKPFVRPWEPKVESARK